MDKQQVLDALEAKVIRTFSGEFRRVDDTTWDRKVAGWKTDTIIANPRRDPRRCAIPQDFRTAAGGGFFTPLVPGRGRLRLGWGFDSRALGVGVRYCKRFRCI